MTAMAHTVKAALEKTERAQSIARDAIQLANNNTKETTDLINSVSLTNKKHKVIKKINSSNIECKT